MTNISFTLTSKGQDFPSSRRGSTTSILATLAGFSLAGLYLAPPHREPHPVGAPIRQGKIMSVHSKRNYEIFLMAVYNFFHLHLKGARLPILAVGSTTGIFGNPGGILPRGIPKAPPHREPHPVGAPVCRGRGKFPVSAFKVKLRNLCRGQ